MLGEEGEALQRRIPTLRATKMITTRIKKALREGEAPNAAAVVIIEAVQVQIVAVAEVAPSIRASLRIMAIARATAHIQQGTLAVVLQGFTRREAAAEEVIALLKRKLPMTILTNQKEGKAAPRTEILARKSRESKSSEARVAAGINKHLEMELIM